MILMFAIPNCDTVKKARLFLDDNKINYEFIDFKKCPPTTAQINAWSDYVGDLPVNKNGTTYRKYNEHFTALDRAEKIKFIIANTSLIKRPILMENGSIIAVGFNEEQYKKLLLEHD